jgi:predicted PurR-regulated permease PerM
LDYMAQSVTNIGEKRPEQPQAGAPPNLPPPEVAVDRPHPRRKDWAWHAMGLGTIFAMCYFAEEILVTILVSILLAFVLAPIVTFLAKLKVPQWVSALLAVFLLLAVVGGTAYLGLNHASDFLHELPQYSKRLHAKVADFSHKTQSLASLGQFDEKGEIKVRETTNWTDLLTRGFGSVTEGLLTASFVPVLVFFMLTWQEHARNATVGLFPLERRREAYTTLGMIAAMVRNFILGNLMIALLIGGISTAVFALLNIPFFYFAGLLSGFLSLVPYFGAVLAVLPPLFMGVGKLDLAGIGWIFVTVFTLHLTAMNVLYPKLLGSRLRLNPLAVTIALLFWAWLWGAVGLVLAVPITAAMKIIFDNVASLKPFGVWLGEDGPLENGAQGSPTR